MQDEHTIRAVLFREGDWWVAQCLDVDIAAQARTEEDLCHELGRLLVGRILAGERLGIDPFKSLPPAPKRYWDMGIPTDLVGLEEEEPYFPPPDA